MHFSDFPPRSAPARLALLTVCALLPAFTREAAAGGMPRAVRRGAAGTLHLPPSPSPASEPASVSMPYLLIGPPPGLRFAELAKLAPPIPAPAAALDPPHPGNLQEDASALDQAAAPTPSAPLPASASAAPSAELPPAASLASDGTGPLSIPTAPPQIGITILPDDTPRAIRAEDVLVYFQFPATSQSDGPPPRSSATYQQK